MVKKTPHHNKSKIKATENGQQKTFLDDYLDMFTFQRKPVTQSFLDMLAESLVLWFNNNPDALLVTDFLEAKHVNRDSFYRWLKLSPKLKEVHEFVKMKLCNRRETGALRNKLNATMVAKVHGYYSDIWTDEVAKTAALTKQEDNKPTNITLIKTPF